VGSIAILIPHLLILAGTQEIRGVAGATSSSAATTTPSSLLGTQATHAVGQTAGSGDAAAAPGALALILAGSRRGGRLPGRPRTGYGRPTTSTARRSGAIRTAAATTVQMRNTRGPTNHGYGHLDATGRVGPEEGRGDVCLLSAWLSRGHGTTYTQVGLYSKFRSPAVRVSG